MKTRIVTGIVFGSALLCILFLCPAVCLPVVLSLLCGMAVYEILHVTGAAQQRQLLVFSVVFAMLVPFFQMLPNHLPAIGAFLVYTIALACIQVKSHESLCVEQTGLAFFVSVVIPVSLSCLGYMRLHNEHGLFYVMLGLIMPWTCDIGAYFVGTFFGRHKLCPKISPKKTVEGLVGGIVVSIGCSVLAGFLYERLFLEGPAVALWQIALIALICAPLSVIGDLFASIIKRQHDVKDFGKVFPGHGGVMDRFDSLILTAPVLYLVLLVWPLVY